MTFCPKSFSLTWQSIDGCRTPSMYTAYSHTLLACILTQTPQRTSSSSSLVYTAVLHVRLQPQPVARPDVSRQHKLMCQKKLLYFPTALCVLSVDYRGAHTHALPHCFMMPRTMWRTKKADENLLQSFRLPLLSSFVSHTSAAAVVAGSLGPQPGSQAAQIDVLLSLLLLY